MKQPNLIPINLGGEELYQLASDYTFFAGGEPEVIRTGFVLDGTSSPRWAWPFLPPDGTHRAATLKHDWSYSGRGLMENGTRMRRRDVDYEFYQDLLFLNHLPRWKINVIYLTVKIFGIFAWFSGDGSRLVLPLFQEQVSRAPGPYWHPTHLRHTRGRISTFGGPYDSGVTPSEGLALFTHLDLHNPKHQPLFLACQPEGTTGMARRLNPHAHYIAMRWNYAETPRRVLRGMTMTVTAHGKSVTGVRPVDWGPNIRTRRVMDISPGLAKTLGLDTDDVATVSYLCYDC